MFNLKEKRIEGITDDDIYGWMARFPTLLIEQELQTMLLWCVRKGISEVRDGESFIVKWLTRTTEFRKNKAHS